ncbi:VanZ family protein [Solobacterium moorei]|uniref:VanZ family protein n=1 Tax=Solobacterium moorei TaxID=102148 RepID=UPI0028EB5128|nr:VanZ family protein [Solobacterium moorei]
MKKLRILHIIVISMISYFLFYCVTSKFLAIHFQGVYAVMAPIFLLTFIGQTLIFYGGSYLLLDPSHRIPAFVFRLLWIIYFLVMFLLLFFRVYQDNNINLNLLKPFNFETTNLSQVTLNLILFIPIGYWLNWFKISSALLISLLLITSIELLQFVSHRGIFDVVDILINTIGIMIGYIIFKTFNIKLH